MTKEMFWEWFDSNRKGLEEFISSPYNDREVYEQLTEKIQQYSTHLMPELTIDKDRKFVLIISCDGIKDGIPFVESITSDLKPYDNWVIHKYRQPGPMESIPINDIDLKRSDIFIEWERLDDNKFDVTLFVKGFTAKNPSYTMATYLHLDHTIGEYNAMTKIETLEIKKLGLFQSTKNLKSLDEFKSAIDECHSKQYR